MAERKETPDVLGELLGGGPVLPEPPSSPTGAPIEGSRRQPAGRATERAPRPGQVARWEYRIASFQEHRGWRLHYVDGVEISNWIGGPLIHDYAAECGEEGWELAGVATGRPVYGLGDSYQLYFKRRKQ